MTIMIHNNLQDRIIRICSDDKRFQQTWGTDYLIDPPALAIEMEMLSGWVNNELDEECFFVIE